MNSVSLTGVDLSSDMLGMARSEAGPAVKLVQGDFRCLPFADESFDAVVFASVLHYVPNARSAVAEAARVLRVGGRLVVTEWCGDSVLMRVLAGSLNRRAHVRGDVAQIFIRRRRELYALLSEAGFLPARSVHYRAGILWRLITIVATRRSCRKASTLAALPIEEVT